MFKKLGNLFRKNTTWNARTLHELFQEVGGTTASGISVTMQSALAQATFFACLRVLGESVGSLELDLYKRGKNGSKSKADDHPLFKVLHSKPNGFQTSLGFREMLTVHSAARGAGYAHIVQTSSGVSELLPIDSKNVTPKQNSDWSLSFDVNETVGNETTIKRYSQEQIFRVSGMTLDGVTPVSVLRYGREAIGLSLSAQGYSSQTFKNGGKVPGVITHPGQLTPEGFKALQEKLNAGGPIEAKKIKLIDEDMKWQQVGMTAEDLQFIDTMKIAALDICAFFRMPPHKVGILDNATFSNIEHQELQFYTGCLLAWLERWEQAIYCQLLTPKEQEKYFPEFNISSMLRGDIVSRFKAYQIAIMYGIFCPDECRAMENVSTRPDGLGSVYYYAANLIPATPATVLERDFSGASSQSTQPQASDPQIFADNNNNDPAKGDNILREQQGKKRFLLNTYVEERKKEMRNAA